MVVKSTELYKASIRIDEDGSGRQALYRYILLECVKEIECCDGVIALPCYGIEIKREDIIDGEVCSTESDSMEDITTYKHKAVQLLKKLYINLVSPIHLFDIVGPIVDEWVKDFDERVNSIAAK